MNADAVPLVHIALTDEGHLSPGPLTCKERCHVISCLHAVGSTFASTSIRDGKLNEFVDVLSKDIAVFPLPSLQGLLTDLKHLEWPIFLAEVADMHGEILRDRYRKTAEWIIRGLKEADAKKVDRKIGYFRWET